MVETVAPHPPKALVRLALAFDGAEKEVERLESLVKTAKAVAMRAEKKFVDEMITQDVESFRTPEIGGFRRQVCVYPNVKDREALGAWVKKKKLTWLYTTAVNGNKLRSFVKELLENGKAVPPGIEPYMQTEIRRFK